MKKFKRPLLYIVRVFIALCLFQTTAQAAELDTCGYADLRLVMEQVPANFPSYVPNQRIMFDLYNIYADFFGETSDDDDWGTSNFEDEFIGFPSNAAMKDQTGKSWDEHSCIAICLRWFWPGDICGEAAEVDIAFNPYRNWTYDKDFAEENTGFLYYQSVAIHELGHALGLTHPDGDYQFTVPTVMHSYNSQTVQEFMIHAPDVKLLREVYGTSPIIMGIPYPPMAYMHDFTNMAIISKFANSTGDWENATVDLLNPSTYKTGDTITVQNLTIENTGTEDVNGAKVNLYLSSSRGPSNYLLGSWSMSNFPAETWGVYDFTGHIPGNIPKGTYFLVAQILADGVWGDSLSFDDTTHLWDKVNVLPRTLTITNPPQGNAGTWWVNENRNITWNSQYLSGTTVSIHISRDNGQTWSLIQSNVPNSGNYNWIVAKPTSTTCRIKITSDDYDFLSDTSGYFSIANPLATFIRITNPKEGETFYSGETLPIFWEIVGLDNALKNVRIEISTDDGANWSYLSFSSPSTDFGFFNYQIAKSGQYCRIRVTSVDFPSVTGISPTFSMFSAPQVLMLYPNGGGETFYEGDIIEVLRSAMDIDRPVAFEISYDNGSTWRPVPNLITNSQGRHMWYIDSTIPLSSQCRMRVYYADVSTPQKDWSNNTFSIAGPRSITITEPKLGGDFVKPLWKMGETYEIKWNSIGDGSYVSLYYSYDHGSTHLQGVINSTTNDGSFSWQVPVNISPSETVRIWVKSPEDLVNNWSDEFKIMPQISLVEPAGGENWYIGESGIIRWNSKGSGGLVKIVLSRNGGSTWTILAAATEDDGYFVAANLMGPTSDNCLVKISYVDYPAVNSITSAPHSILAPRITVTGPAEGDVWYVGETRTVNWSSNLTTGDHKVIIEESCNQIFWTLLTKAEGVLNDGYEEVPVTWKPGQQCNIRVSLVNMPASDTSDIFITALPSLELTSPNGGEKYYLGDTVDIIWKSTRDESFVKIEFSVDKGSSWKTITDSAPNKNHYEWTINDGFEGERLLKISNTYETRIFDISDGPFDITINPNDLDNDKDSFSFNQGDCNDADDTVFPGAKEICDNIDNNCNGQSDEGVKLTFYRDADSDGYGNQILTTQACTQPAGYLANNTDCNDASLSVHPGAPEVCNGVDDNCNGSIDEGVTITYYRDADADGYGNPAVITQACSAPAGYVANNADCNDNSVAARPGLTEGPTGNATCSDTLDNNCDGAIDVADPGCAPLLTPDLVVTVFTAPPTAMPGTAITIGDSTINNGTGPAGASTTRFYWSTNKTYNANDILLGSRAIPELTAGAVSSGNIIATVPQLACSGTFYIIFRSDANKVVAETNETNNNKAKLIKTGNDLIVVSAPTAPAISGASMSITVTDTTKNQGGCPAVASTTSYYLSPEMACSATST